jgi:hypothetical protein
MKYLGEELEDLEGAPLIFESPDGRWRHLIYHTKNSNGKIIVDDEVWEAQDIPSNFEDIESDN